MDSGARGFPLHLWADHGSLLVKEGRRANISKSAEQYVADTNASEEDLFYHALAVLHAPAYRVENAGARHDWPRIPLPTDSSTLKASAALGKQIAALMDTESDVAGVTSGKVFPALKTIGLISKTGGGQIDATGDDLKLTAGWGHFGKEGITMPGKGKLIEREYGDDEAKAVQAEAAARGVSAGDVLQLLGDKTCDVYLNGAAYWRNVPLNVWEYTMGGYQVIKKWLSYREEPILGRALKPEEVREVTNMTRRIAALILLQPALDENYRNVKARACGWPPS